MRSYCVTGRARWLSGVWPSWVGLAFALALGVSYYLAVRVGLLLTVGTHPVSLMWPANAVVLGSLLIRPQKEWPLLVLAVLPSHLISEYGNGIPLGMVLCWYVSNCFEALLGAATVRLFVKREEPLDGFRSICAFFAFGVIIAPIVSSFADASFVALNRWGSDPFWAVWRMRTFSNTFAAATLGVAILTWAEYSPKLKWRAGRLIECTLLSLGLATTVELVLTHPSALRQGFSGSLWTYAPWPFLLWAAMRFGPRGASGALLLVSSLSIWRAVSEHAPFLAADEQSVRSMQLFFVAMSLTLIPFAAVLIERKRVEQDLRDSEQRYRGIVETQPDLVCRFLADTTLTFVNRAYCNFFGLTQEELLGRKFLDFVPPERHETVLLHVATIFTSRETLIHEHEVMLPGGGIGWQQWINHPIVNEDGQIREVQAIGRDVTLRKATEAVLHETQARNHAMLTALPDSIFLIDKHGMVLDYHSHDPTLIQIPEEKAVGSLISDVLPEQLAKTLYATYQASPLSGDPRIAECTLALPGENRSYEIRVVNCGINRVLGLIRDITDQKRAEEAKQSLIHVSRLAVVGEFTAMMSHEVSQPLSTMLINAQAAQKVLQQSEPSLKEIRAILNDIQEDTVRARDTITRMRALSQKRPMEVQLLDVNQVVKDVVHVVAGDARRRSVAIKMNLASVLLDVYGDPVLIQHVLLNLVSNAMEAMTGLPIPERLIIMKTESRNDGTIMVSVSDMGHGIAPEKLDKVFESFFSTKHEGVGLGLSIARTVVQAHQGRIWAENNPDKGATFYFTLPASVHVKFGGTNAT